MNPIKITFIPHRRPIIKHASSRLRAKYLIDHISKIFPDKYSANFDDLEHADIVVINQSIRESDFTQLKQMKDRRDLFVIFDIVDRLYDKSRKLFNQIVDYSNLITVANELQYIQIKEKLKKTIPIAILPDGIDYYEQLDTRLVPFNGKVVWFGNYKGGNLESSKWAMNYIANHKDYSISAIGMSKHIELKGAEVVEWKYEGFIKTFKKYSICFLSHDHTEQQKSNNRLLVSIANGIPAIVSGSTTYAELLHRFKLDFAIVKNESELQNALTILSDNKARKKYLSKIQPFVIENYNFRVITERFDQIIENFYIE